MSFGESSNDISSLTNYVNDISKQYKCPMSSVNTGMNRITQTYCCRFGGRVRGTNSAKSNCPAFVQFIREDDGSYSLKKAKWEHNHKVDIEIFESRFNTCTTQELNEIRNQCELGVAPTQIRSNLDIRMNSKNFYYHRHSIKKNRKKNL